MELSKKQNEINVLAKYLRRSIENVDDLKQAVKVLFKGEAELSLDNDEQFVVYTGQTFDRNYQTRDSVHSISSHEFLNADG
jgi:ABC-type siderophore export system fused ATPase/permease subunit